jgi:hypothetical protein
MELAVLLQLLLRRLLVTSRGGDRHTLIAAHVIIIVKSDRSAKLIVGSYRMHSIDQLNRRVVCMYADSRRILSFLFDSLGNVLPGLSELRCNVPYFCGHGHLLLTVVVNGQQLLVNVLPFNLFC